MSDGAGRSPLADRFVSTLVSAYFTKTNLLLHALVYPFLMALEGGDFHLFLDGISIEAVFVGLMVGISTKQVIERHHGLHSLVREVLGHVRREEGRDRGPQEN